jgi:nitroreductase
VKWGPTSGNLQPARIVFVRSEDGRRKLYPALEGMGRNPEQVRAAPVTAIIAQDARFFDEAPRLFPRTNFKPMSENGARKRLISLGNQVRQPWRNSLSSFKVSPEFHQINGLTLTGACASR